MHPLEKTRDLLDDVQVTGMLSPQLIGQIDQLIMKYLLAIPTKIRGMILSVSESLGPFPKALADSIWNHLAREFGTSSEGNLQ